MSRIIYMLGAIIFLIFIFVLSIFFFAMPWWVLKLDFIYELIFKTKMAENILISSLISVFCGFFVAEIAYTVSIFLDLKRKNYFHGCYILIIVISIIYALSFSFSFANQVGYIFYFMHPFCMSYLLFCILLSNSISTRKNTVCLLTLLPILLITAGMRTPVITFPM